MSPAYVKATNYLGEMAIRCGCGYAHEYTYIHGRRFLFNIGGPLVEAPKAPRSNAEGVRIGAEGCGVWPLGEGHCPLPENLSIADLKMVSFDAFCVVF